MPKKKSLEELRQKEAKMEKKYEQATHELTRIQNKIGYLKSRDRKQRDHRLITRGAEFESIFKGTDCLDETEFLDLMEIMAEQSVNQMLVDRAIYHHMRKVKQQGGNE